jgi:hypothetical protein
MKSPQDSWMLQKTLIYTRELLIIIFKKVLIFVIILISLVVLSFLFWGELTIASLSDRLFWVGLVIMLSSGILALGQTAGGRDFGPMIVTSAQASLLTDFNIEVRQDVERKFTPIWRIFSVGLTCFLFAILISVIFG